MVKLVALYRQPDDPEAFDSHYDDEHTPLVRKIPDLERLEVGRVTGSPAGDSPYYLLAEMYFADAETMNRALGSDAGQAAARDLMGFAGDVVEMMFVDVTDDETFGG